MKRGKGKTKGGKNRRKQDIGKGKTENKEGESERQGKK
jgi:hypothetical protein